ncbi:MAG TPA: hypothetical protein VIM76_03235 [Candidatus Dormibacteraeota bacterium]|jgi:hypothetical protein
MTLTALCDCNGEPTPIFRLSAVLLDGRMARVCPKCAAKYRDRIEYPYWPRSDQATIQPSTTREAW